MNNIKKTAIVAIVSLLIGGFVGYELHGTSSQSIATAPGDTYSTSKIAQIVLDLSTTTAGSQYNGDSRDRIISSVDYYAAGLTTAKSNATGLSSLSWTLSTSTDVYLAASTNYLLNTTIATTSPQLYVASSTPGGTGSVFVRVWQAGTYLNLFQNGTSTANATLVVRYFVSQ